MGWSFGWNSKAELVKYLTETSEGSETKYSTVASKVVGAELWMVREIIEKASGKSEKVIAVCLLEKSKSDWGYKGMDESMYPYYYRCPVSFFEMAPVANAGWRAAVRNYHAVRNQKIAVGQMLTLSNGKSYTVTSKIGAKVYARGEDNVVYRIPKSMLTLPATVEAVAA